LTHAERGLALEQVRSKLAELEAGKDAPAARLDALRARVALLERPAEAYRHPLKHEVRMRALWGRTVALEPLADKAGPKGRWSTKLSAQEVHALGEKEELDAELDALARASRFWFEEEAELAQRVAGAKALVKASRRVARNVAGMAAPAQPKPAGWATVPSSKPRKAGAAAPVASKSGGNAFGALGGDDSDSD
jgi:hypothetical protein